MKGKIIPLVILAILAVALPLLLIVGKKTLDNRTHAAAADKLEAESGVLGGNAVSKADSNASGGSYVELQRQSSPTPTPSQRVYFGAALPGWQNRAGEVDAFETKAGKKLSILHFYIGWSSAYPNLPITEMNGIRSRGTIPLLTWEPASSTTDSTHNLASIINGNHDTYITKFAVDSKNWGHPYFLRFAHEMNGNWTGWSETKNGNSTGDYVKAWKHIHDIFLASGATNITWVWCPNVESSTTTPLAGLYPGDTYVDWICLDGYNWSSVDGSPWMTFSQVFKPSYDKIISIAPTKPVMIGETGSIEAGGSKANWITDTYTTQVPINFPKIKAILWFNFVASGADWRIDTSTSSLNAFKTAVSSTKYTSNSFGSITSSPIQSP